MRCRTDSPPYDRMIIRGNNLTPTMPDQSESEASRQAALDQYEIVDTFAEQAYDDLTSLAADTFGTPIAVIAFLDRDRNWFQVADWSGSDSCATRICSLRAFASPARRGFGRQ